MKNTFIGLGALLLAACSGSDAADSRGNSSTAGAGGGASGAAGAASAAGAGAGAGASGTSAADAKLCGDACAVYKSCADVDGSWNPPFDLSKCTSRCELETGGGGIWRPEFARFFYGWAAGRGSDPMCTLKDQSGFGFGGLTFEALSYAEDAGYKSCYKVATEVCSQTEAVRTSNCIRTEYAASAQFRAAYAACDALDTDCTNWTVCYEKTHASQGLGDGRAPWLGQ